MPPAPLTLTTTALYCASLVVSAGTHQLGLVDRRVWYLPLALGLVTVCVATVEILQEQAVRDRLTPSRWR